MQTLERRSVGPHERNEFLPPASDPRPTAPPNLAAIPSPPQSAPPAKQPTSRDVAEIVDIFQELKAALPEAQETTVRAFASTLFMQRRKEEPEF